jgi:NitT/TauT family transport system permease protein
MVQIGMNDKKKINSTFWMIMGSLAVLIIWEFAARTFSSALILPGPLPVAKELFRLFSGPRFIPAAGGSFLRVLFSLMFALPLSLLIGIPAGLNQRFNAFLRPVFSIISATPVLSIILIALLWFGQNQVPVFAAFLMVFPVMTANTIAGVRSSDAGLLEMTRVYGFTGIDTLRHLYLPSLAPYLLAGARSSLALAWKVVVAAEVLSQPTNALGTGMQTAKAQLETTELFAWTVVTVVFAGICDLGLAFIYKRKQNVGIA